MYKEDPYDNYTIFEFKSENEAIQKAAIRQLYDENARPVQLFCIHKPSNSNRPLEGNFQSAEDALRHLVDCLDRSSQFTSVKMNGTDMLASDEVKKIVNPFGQTDLHITVESINF